MENEVHWLEHYEESFHSASILYLAALSAEKATCSFPGLGGLE